MILKAIFYFTNPILTRKTNFLFVEDHIEHNKDDPHEIIGNYNVPCAKLSIISYIHKGREHCDSRHTITDYFKHQDPKMFD